MKTETEEIMNNNTYRIPVMYLGGPLGGGCDVLEIPEITPYQATTLRRLFNHQASDGRWLVFSYVSDERSMVLKLRGVGVRSWGEPVRWLDDKEASQYGQIYSMEESKPFASDPRARRSIEPIDWSKSDLFPSAPTE